MAKRTGTLAAWWDASSHLGRAACAKSKIARACLHMFRYCRRGSIAVLRDHASASLQINQSSSPGAVGSRENGRFVRPGSYLHGVRAQGTPTSAAVEIETLHESWPG